MADNETSKTPQDLAQEFLQKQAHEEHRAKYGVPSNVWGATPATSELPENGPHSALPPVAPSSEVAAVPLVEAAASEAAHDH